MGNVPLPASSGTGVFSLRASPSEPVSQDVALLGVLREAAIAGPLSTDAMLNALADASRVLSGADGTAIASRKEGIIVCRARSGDMAPDLGAPLNSDSGISGECLRTASIQICADAETDARVDSDACRTLGIRSVAVVPLRGRTGMFGVLEAFSARTNAFNNEQIDALRSLAEIAETAYERERKAANPALPTPAPLRPALFPAPARVEPDAEQNGEQDQDSERWSIKVYGWIACATITLLAITWTVRMSWRHAGAEIAASAATRQPVASTTSAPNVEPFATTKPDPSIRSHQGERVPKSPVENSADTDIDRSPKTSALSIREEPAGTKRSPANTFESAPPPPVQIAVNNVREELPKLGAESEPLPRFGGSVSQGIVPAALVERVDPPYPLEARSHGISGDVILDATVAEDGSVHKVTVVSGPGILANAAIIAVRKWRFSPAMLNGKPLEVQKRITIAFKMP